MSEQINIPEGGLAALVASPNTAMRLLDCSRESLYRLINSGELESYCEGRSRKIIVASIHALIERRLAAARAKRAA
jgi:excisionase family DNA binding protein